MNRRYSAQLTVEDMQSVPGGKVNISSTIYVKKKLFATQKVGERNFSLLQNVQGGSGAHHSSYSMDTEVRSRDEVAGT